MITLKANNKKTEKVFTRSLVAFAISSINRVKFLILFKNLTEQKHLLSLPADTIKHSKIKAFYKVKY